VFDTVLNLVGCSPFVNPCGGRWKWKTRSADDNEDVWNDLTFFHSVHDPQPPSIPQVVQLDNGKEEDLSTIYDQHAIEYSYVDGEDEYQDLHMVMEELELELKEESKGDDETASLEIIMGPKPLPPPPPSQISSSRSVASTAHISSPSLPSPSHRCNLKRVMTDAEPTTLARMMASTFQGKEEENVERLASSVRYPHTNIIVSSSSSYTYSGSQGDSKDDTSDSGVGDGSSYSSSCRLLLGDTKRRSFDFSSVYRHRYHPSPREQNQLLSFQTSSTDTTMQIHNRSRGRFRSSLSAIWAH
jgi:hypothetical protein